MLSYANINNIFIFIVQHENFKLLIFINVLNFFNTKIFPPEHFFIFVCFFFIVCSSVTHVFFQRFAEIHKRIYHH